MKRFIATCIGVAGLAVGGCGGSTSTTTTSTTPSPPVHKAPLAQECPPGHAFMGCSQTGVPAQTFQLTLKNTKKAPHGLTLPSGALFPDVSNWQQDVGWGSVAGWQRSHGWPVGGVFKMGEGNSRDSWASNNATKLSAVHGWKAGYWFVRNVGCQSEANSITAAAHAYGVKLVSADLEVPEAQGYGQCLVPKLRSAGLTVTEYTGPGTNPGGVDTSAPLWEATYGSHFTPLWHPVIAWQFTDGHFGSPVNIPGIGFDDVSVDYGFSKLAGSTPKPDPLAVLSKTVFTFDHGKVHAREYYTAKTWDMKGCKYPLHRKVCITSHDHLGLLANRDWFVAHHTADGKHVANPPRWNTNNLGVRFHMLWVRLGHH